MKTIRFLFCLLALTAPARAVTLTVSADVDDFLTAANDASMRSKMGVAIGTNVQAYSSVLSTYAGINPSANVQSILGGANYAAIRALLDLEAGTDFLSIAATAAAYQPLDSDLTALASLGDPNADRLLFWDDSAGAVAYLTLGTGLSITGTTINASGGGGSFDATSLGDLTWGNGTADDFTWTFHITGTPPTLTFADGIITVGGDFAITGSLAVDAVTATTATIGTFSFEGSTADANETALTVTDPTADRTITLPDATGTVVLSGLETDAFVIAISDETTALTTGTAKVTFRAPYAFTITGVKGSLTTVSSSGTPTWDINESGTTVLSTKLTIDASEKTSATAATAAVVSDASIAADAEITIDIDTAGTGATGGKVTIIHTH